MSRLGYGATKLMTPEEYKQYKRDLGKRYRKNNPDKIKAQNQKYYKLYHDTKPFECICKVCGRKFNAPRKYFKLCDHCKLDVHYTAEMKRKALAIKQEEKRAEYEQIIQMYKDKHTQAVIAETFGRSQSGISQILRRNGIRK